jgi:protein-S-isoprenylcysteine O-methyltransferase Ste14
MKKEDESLLAKIDKLLHYLLGDFGPGPKIFKLNHIINAQKGGSLPFFLALQYYFQNWSKGATIYTALHGSYGLIWLLKDMILPDKNFQENHQKPIPALLSVSCLAAYWRIGWIQMSGRGMNNPSHARVLLAISMFGIGSTLMMCSDAQKYFMLQLRNKYPEIRKELPLLTNGFFKYTRNPNYLGEILIYLSFTVMTGNSESYLILACDWMILFTSFMFMKEMSLSRKKGWAKYKAQSNLLLPRVCKSKSLDTLVWALTFVGGF